MAETLKLPTKVVDSDWKDDIDFELIGGTEKREANYQPNATLIKKSEVKNATTNYKRSKIGRVALFAMGDKLVA